MGNIFSEAWFNLFSQKVPVHYHKVLKIHNEYYRDLDDHLQQKFQKRCLLNVKSTEFIPFNFSRVTEEMKILICSAIVQITFGLNNYSLNRFDRIYVMPYNYDFLNYKNLLGHVDFNAKIICLSWPSVKEGFYIPDDAMNVALHEISHALMEENKFRILGYKFFGDNQFAEWHKEALKKLHVIRANQNKVLSSYGGQNMLEMFAVCMETFFEKTEIFAEHLPNLFNSMVKLLKQDPRQKSNPLDLKSV